MQLNKILTYLTSTLNLKLCLQQLFLSFLQTNKTLLTDKLVLVTVYVGKASQWYYTYVWMNIILKHHWGKYLVKVLWDSINFYFSGFFLNNIRVWATATLRASDWDPQHQKRIREKLLKIKSVKSSSKRC